MARYWYAYIGPCTPSIQFLFPSNYQISGVPSACPAIGCCICVVYATAGSSSFPASFSVNDKQYVAIAIANCIGAPITGKKFVYVKS